MEGEKLKAKPTLIRKVDMRVDKLEEITRKISEDIGGINQRLLPPTPNAEGEGKDKSEPQGWLQEVTCRLSEVLDRLYRLKDEEINRLMEAVEAGKVTKGGERI